MATIGNINNDFRYSTSYNQQPSLSLSDMEAALAVLRFLSPGLVNGDSSTYEPDTGGGIIGNSSYAGPSTLGVGGGGVGGIGTSSLPQWSNPAGAAQLYLEGALNGDGEQNGNFELEGTGLNDEQTQAFAEQGYIYQFATYANGGNPLDPNDLALGQDYFNNMSADAQTFMQVAARYKGKGENYDNGELQNLLQESGFPGANAEGVGDTDVETLGAVAAAIDQGYLTLDQITASGAIENEEAYQDAIDEVQSGTQASLMAEAMEILYGSATYLPGSETLVGGAGGGGGGGGYSGGGY